MYVFHIKQAVKAIVLLMLSQLPTRHKQPSLLPREPRVSLLVYPAPQSPEVPLLPLLLNQRLS